MVRTRRRLAYAPASNGVLGTDGPAPAGRLKRALKRGLIAILIVALVAGGWLAYRNASKLTGIRNPFSLIGSFVPSHLNTTNGRTNILLAGYSADDAGHNGADLTDSIMILSIDAANKKADVISIPRDLYVNIPGHGYDKINAAYEAGEAGNFNQAGYAKGGMGLLEKTVEQTLGVHSNYYALINYTAFRDTVNAVGGVTINVKGDGAKSIYDPNTGIRFSDGQVQLNGIQALALARARGEAYGSYGLAKGDFDRTQNQRALLLALKDKTSSAGVIANPLKIGSLANALGNNVKTDLTIGQLETVYSKVKPISDSAISTHGLDGYNGKNLLMNSAARGQSILVPAAGFDDYTAIQAAINNTLQR